MEPIKRNIKIYLAGSLQNEIVKEIPKALFDESICGMNFAAECKKLNVNVEFWNQWILTGPNVDKEFQKNCEGSSTNEMLNMDIAKAGFMLDLENIMDSDMMIVVGPCGKSAFFEAGFALGQGKPIFYYEDNVMIKYDLMLHFFNLNNYELHIASNSTKEFDKMRRQFFDKKSQFLINDYKTLAENIISAIKNFIF